LLVGVLIAACSVTACNSQKPARTELASEEVMTGLEPAAGIQVAGEDNTGVEPAAGIQVAGDAGRKGIVQYFEFKTDAESKRVEAEADLEPESPKLSVEIDHNTNKVGRKDEAGQVMWSVTLNGYLGSVRPPHLLLDADRTYISHGDGVTALNGRTGKMVWHSPGSNDRLCLSGGLLLATNCTIGDYLKDKGRWVTARASATGEEVFRVRLPLQDFDPLAIKEMAGLILVQKGERPGGEGAGLLFDRDGQIRHRFDRQVIMGKFLGKDRVFLTSRDVIRLSSDDKIIWSLKFSHKWVAGGGIVELEGRDILIFVHGYISDSGVQLIRLNPDSGEVVWRANCSPLGGLHSAYHHWANARVDGARIKVTSRGSHGTIVEYLDTKSGRQLERIAPNLVFRDASTGEVVQP
jgi:outer membrane protein assembly factor BamB